MIVKLTDEEILSIGRRYFELASGKSEVEDNDDKKEEKIDPVKAAYALKEYCDSITCCGNCVFCLDTQSAGLYKCMLYSYNYQSNDWSNSPSQWVLPPKEE